MAVPSNTSEKRALKKADKDDWKIQYITRAIEVG